MPKYWVTGFTEGKPLLPRMEVDCATMAEAVFRFCFVVQHAPAFVWVNTTGLAPHEDDHTRHQFPAVEVYDALKEGTPLFSTQQSVARLHSQIDQLRAKQETLDSNKEDGFDGE